MRVAKVLLVGFMSVSACAEPKHQTTHDASGADDRDGAQVDDEDAQASDEDAGTRGVLDGSANRDGSAQASEGGASEGGARDASALRDAAPLPPGPPVQVSVDSVGTLVLQSSSICRLDGSGNVVCRTSRSDWSIYHKGPFRAFALPELSGGCGIAPDGSASCWDLDNLPSLCRASARDCVGAGVPPAGEKFSQLATERKAACGLTTDGRILCWGSNSYGMTTPPAGSDFVRLAVTMHSRVCAWRRNGSTVCWGGDANAMPSEVAGSYLQMLASESGGCSLRTDGKVECSGTAESLASQPGVEGLAQISMDGYSLCGLSKEGVAHCWTNRNDVFKRVPPPVGPFSTIVNNNVFACGLRGDGEIECWGIDWGNGSGPESCWIEQTRLSLNGQPERAYWVRFGDDHVADAGFRSSSSDSDNFMLLSASAPAALDPRTAAGDAGLTVDTSLWLLDPTEASPGEVYCSGPRANARLERSNDELVLNWSNLSSLGKCPGTEPVAGSLTACPGCASSALSGTLRGEAKNVAESRNTLWPYAPTTNYADGSALILRKNNFNEGKWAVLLTPPDASGVSEVICAGSVSVSKGSGGDMWTLGSFTSLGRCKGGGTSTLKGCMR